MSPAKTADVIATVEMVSWVAPMILMDDEANFLCTLMPSLISPRGITHWNLYKQKIQSQFVTCRLVQAKKRNWRRDSLSFLHLPIIAVSAVTLLVGRQEEHPAC